MMFLVCCILITIRWRLESSTGKTENMGVCTKERKGVTAEVLLPLPALIHWEVKAGNTSMKDVGGAGFAGSSPPSVPSSMMMSSN